MNLEKLWEAEAAFFQAYPQGFADPAIEAIRRKHNVDRLIRYTQENLTRVNCNNPEFVADTFWKVISRSSMVSHFEKPRFRDFLDALGSADKRALAFAVEQRLYGRKQQGFERILEMLAHHRIAKWSVISALPSYFAPRREVFVKPTTVKRILTALEVEDLHYRATPSWSFYRGFRALMADVRRQVSPKLSPSNAALTGFLMMSL